MVQYDYFLAAGLVILVLSLPSIVSAVTEHRAPRVAAIVLLIAGGMIAYATTQKPGGYQISEIPDVILRVVASLTK